MKVVIHGSETFECNPEFAFKRIPDGVYSVRATAHPDDSEPFDFQVQAELKDGTVTFPSFDVPFPKPVQAENKP